MNTAINPFIIQDERGLMGVVDFQLLPFTPKRFFWLTNVPNGESRGGHAHRSCEQFIVCLSGSIICDATDLHGVRSQTKLEPGASYYLPIFTWLDITGFTTDANVGVFASETYNEEEYIRSRDEFNSLSM